MIKSADEFLSLRQSKIPEEYERASKDSASEKVWHEIIEKYPHMKQWVIHNKTIHLKILQYLSDDKDAQVRSCVASKRKLDDLTLKKLSRDKDESVRLAVAYNPKVSKDILYFFLNDEWESIVSVSKKRIKTLEQ